MKTAGTRATLLEDLRPIQLKEDTDPRLVHIDGVDGAVKSELPQASPVNSL
jgi:hypothetical protein